VPAVYGSALITRALFALSRGEVGPSAALLQEALAIAHEIGDRAMAVVVLDNLGSVARARGDADAAARLYREALVASEQIRFDWMRAQASGHLGATALDRGDVEGAASMYREALDGLWAQRDRRTFAGTLAGYTAVLAAAGRYGEAARLCGAVESLCEAIGVALSPSRRAHHDRLVADLRRRLGDERYRVAWTEGRALTPEMALAEATATAGPRDGTERGGPRRHGRADGSGLTGREFQVLRLLTEGRANAEIAEALSISERTVENHVRHLLAKLGVASRSAAVAYAIRQGLA
jgi:non-specific serine/threonine protein kinase